MLGSEPGREVAQSPDDGGIGRLHRLTNLTGKDQHQRSVGQPMAASIGQRARPDGYADVGSQLMRRFLSAWGR
jgi:hypothetical protein